MPGRPGSTASNVQRDPIGSNVRDGPTNNFSNDPLSRLPKKRFDGASRGGSVRIGLP